MVVVMSEINWEVMPKPKPEVCNVLVLEKGEEILISWDGNVETIGKAVITKGTLIKRHKVVEAKERKKGTLVLTNRRLLWVTKRGIFGKSYHVTHEVPLEEVKGVSSGGTISKYVSILSPENEYRFHLLGTYGSIQKFNPLMRTAMETRKKEIETEKRKARVHIMLDFSSLKDYMKKGGLVLQTVKCPVCSGPLKLPKSGNQTTCEHCKNTVYAQDIFEKVKALIG